MKKYMALVTIIILCVLLSLSIVFAAPTFKYKVGTGWCGHNRSLRMSEETIGYDSAKIYSEYEIEEEMVFHLCHYKTYNDEFYRFIIVKDYLIVNDYFLDGHSFAFMFKQFMYRWEHIIEDLWPYEPTGKESRQDMLPPNMRRK